MRFYRCGLHEAGMISSTPTRVVDVRFPAVWAASPSAADMGGLEGGT